MITTDQSKNDQLSSLLQNNLEMLEKICNLKEIYKSLSLIHLRSLSQRIVVDSHPNILKSLVDLARGLQTAQITTDQTGRIHLNRFLQPDSEMLQKYNLREIIWSLSLIHLRSLSLVCSNSCGQSPKQYFQELSLARALANCKLD